MITDLTKNVKAVKVNGIEMPIVSGGEPLYQHNLNFTNCYAKILSKSNVPLTSTTFKAFLKDNYNDYTNPFKAIPNNLYRNNETVKRITETKFMFVDGNNESHVYGNEYLFDLANGKITYIKGSYNTLTSLPTFVDKVVEII